MKSVDKTQPYSYTSNRRSTFAYDINGNVTNDATNSLQTSYNLLNFPAQTKSGSTVKANYSYLSDGTKASVLNASGAGYDYNGTFTYSHASGGTRALESVAFGGGRIRKNGSTYAVDYYVTDHLGSVRAIVNASGTIVEQNDFYPFGTRQQNGLTTLSANRWRFSGKEGYDNAFGIALDDFGARRYDRTAWTSIDPLAEKYYSLSPYAYCAGNPVNFVDPEGDWAHVAIGAAVGAAVNGVVAIAQHKSGWEVFAAAAGGAVEGAITAATGGLNLYARVGVGIAASVAGDVIEQTIGTGDVTGREVASSAVAGIFSSVFSNIVSDGIDVLSKSAIIKVDKKYASEEVQHLIRKEVKKEAYSAGKTLGKATKQSVKAEVSTRIKDYSEFDKSIIDYNYQALDSFQSALIGQGVEGPSNYLFDAVF